MLSSHVELVVQPHRTSARFDKSDTDSTRPVTVTVTEASGARSANAGIADPSQRITLVVLEVVMLAGE